MLRNLSKGKMGSFQFGIFVVSPLCNLSHAQNLSGWSNYW